MTLAAPVHILLAEDEVLIAELFRMVLEERGYRVTLASDGAAAAAADAADPADLLLTDVRMPRKDGVALAGELRGRRPGLPVILMTGHNDAETLPRPPGHGPTVRFTKPVMAQELLTTIDTLLPAAA